MPGRYDKAACATALRLRNEILEKVRSWRRPRNAFEVRNPKADHCSDVDSETSETSTFPVLADKRNGDISDLYSKVPKFEDYV